MQSAMVFLAGLLLAYDFQNVLSWWKGRVVDPVDEPTDDFTVVVPVYGHPRYFAERAHLEPYKPNVLVALEITPPAMAAFADELEAEGWRVARFHLDEPDPATLLRLSLAQVSTTLALRLDADTRPSAGLELAVAAVLASGADLCSVKCEVENTTNLVTKMQHLEYRMAMLGRHIRPWLTSGACFIGRTVALERLYAQHSLWTPGEDIETGVVAKALRMKVRHCDYIVSTDAPDTWRSLYKQRRLWWAGNFRHWSVNVDKNLVHRPVMTLYACAGIWCSVYWKWWGMVNLRALPFTLFALWVFYVFWMFVANFKVRSRFMLLMPFYSLAQGLFMPALGAWTYVRIARRRGCLGRYRFGYRKQRAEITPA